MSDEASAYFAPVCRLVMGLQCWSRTVWRDGDAREYGPWGTLLIVPTSGYLESSAGPVPLRKIEWVDVSTKKVSGGLRGLPLKMTDHRGAILAKLGETAIPWELRESTWSHARFFDEQPVEVIRIANPYGPVVA